MWSLIATNSKNIQKPSMFVCAWEFWKEEHWINPGYSKQTLSKSLWTINARTPPPPPRKQPRGLCVLLLKRKDHKLGSGVVPTCNKPQKTMLMVVRGLFGERLTKQTLFVNGWNGLCVLLLKREDHKLGLGVVPNCNKPQKTMLMVVCGLFGEKLTKQTLFVNVWNKCSEPVHEHRWLYTPPKTTTGALCFTLEKRRP